jgi:rubrerythrin
MADLSNAEIDALREALDDEYRALATYDRVIEDFGPVRPFISIREAEARHIAALGALFERYGLPLPRNAWAGKVTRFASVHAACQAGVAAEIENSRLYARLLAQARRADIRAVFRRLQEASQLRHLPAFRRCLARRRHDQTFAEEPVMTVKSSRPGSPSQRRHRRRARIRRNSR